MNAFEKAGWKTKLDNHGEIDKKSGSILQTIEKGNYTSGHQTNSKYKISKIVVYGIMCDIYDFERSQKLLISVEVETVSNLQFPLRFVA